VLAQAAMPSIMVETGFITNPEEELFLMSEQGQDFIASSIFRAFRDYKEIVESKRSLTAFSGKKNESHDSSTANTKPDSVTPAVTAETKPTETIPKTEFKVQIAASSKPVALNSHVFKGLTGVSEYRVGKIYKYAVGSSPTFQDIIAYSKVIKEKFPDAFIIAVKDNNIIPLDQALTNK
jgi:N-acetylmuramoyl-L-alanine amidase